MTTITQASTQTLAAVTHPEIELILCCCRPTINTATTQRIQTLLQNNIDWAYLVQTASRHGVMPLLYQNLQSTCPDAIPKTIREQLRHHFHANAMHNLFLTKELLQLLNLFQDHDICAIPFKGPTLAATAYGSIALRQFCDLDILVSPRDSLRANKLLTSQGYERARELHWQSHWLREDGMINIDLHQALTPKKYPFSLNFEELWERLQPISLAGTRVLNLSPEDSLLILSTHLARDCWQERERLTQIVDIAALIHVHPSMDWERLMRQATRVGSKRMLFLSLLLTYELLGIELPDKVLSKVQIEPVVKSLAAQVCQWLFCEADRPPRGIKKKLFYFRVREHIQDTLPYFIHLAHLWIAPSKADRAFLPLPASLSFLYYLVRPIRVISTHISHPATFWLRLTAPTVYRSLYTSTGQESDHSLD